MAATPDKKSLSIAVAANASASPMSLKQLALDGEAALTPKKKRPSMWSRSFVAPTRDDTDLGRIAHSMKSERLRPAWLLRKGCDAKKPYVLVVTLVQSMCELLTEECVNPNGQPDNEQSLITLTGLLNRATETTFYLEVKFQRDPFLTTTNVNFGDAVKRMLLAAASTRHFTVPVLHALDSVLKVLGDFGESGTSAPLFAKVAPSSMPLLDHNLTCLRGREHCCWRLAGVRQHVSMEAARHRDEGGYEDSPGGVDGGGINLGSVTMPCADSNCCCRFSIPAHVAWFVASLIEHDEIAGDSQQGRESLRWNLITSSYDTLLFESLRSPNQELARCANIALMRLHAPSRRTPALLRQVFCNQDCKVCWRRYLCQGEAGAMGDLDGEQCAHAPTEAADWGITALSNARGYVKVAAYETAAKARGAESIAIEKSEHPNRYTVERLRQVSSEMWKLPPPNMIISVTGAAQAFTLRDDLSEAFMTGLMRTARLTGSWVVTGGTDVGVMHEVGKARAAYGPTVPLIGVTAWDALRPPVRRTLCINATEEQPKKWDMVRQSAGQMGASLDPNHSHFILVAQAPSQIEEPAKEEVRFGGEIQMRSLLEKDLRVPRRLYDLHRGKVPTDSVFAPKMPLAEIPIVLVVVQGGPGTLSTVHAAVRERCPVVLVAESGQAAGTLAECLEQAEEHFSGEGCPDCTVEKSCPAFEETSSLTFSKYFHGKIPDSRTLSLIYESVVVQDTVNPNNQRANPTMGSYHQAPGADGRAFDQMMLRTIMTRYTAPLEKLKVCISLNRLDFAREIIMKSRKIMSQSQLDQAAFLALQMDRPGIVAQLVDIGSLLDVQPPAVTGVFFDFELQKLYRGARNCARTTPVTYLFEREHNSSTDPEQFRSETIDRIIATVWGNDCLFKHSDLSWFENLIVFAVLLHRHDMAMVFWQRVQQPIHMALIATHLYRRLADIADAEPTGTLPESIGLLRRHADEFEEMATGVLGTVAKNTEVENAAWFLLSHKFPATARDEGCTCITTAFSGNCEKFMTHWTVEKAIGSYWNSGFALSNSSLAYLQYPILLLSFLFPPLLFMMEIEEFSLREDLRSQWWMLQRFSRRTKREWWDWLVREQWLRLQTLYSAVCARFILHVVVYIGFLGLFTEVVTAQDSSFVSAKPAALLANIWVFSLLLGELMELVGFRDDDEDASLWGRLTSIELNWAYFSDPWNVNDISMLLLYLIGFAAEATGMESRAYIAISLILFYVRLFEVFSVNEFLGPLLMVVFNMAKIIMIWSFIFLVLCAAFGFAFEISVKGHNVFADDETGFRWILSDTLPSDIAFLDKLTTTYWTLFKGASAPLEEFESGGVLAYTLAAVWAMLCNVLIINLLMAVMWSKYNGDEGAAHTTYVFLSYGVIKDYQDDSPLPPPMRIPFNCIASIGSAVSSWWETRKSSKVSPGGSSEAAGVNIEDLTLPEAEQAGKQLMYAYNHDMLWEILRTDLVTARDEYVNPSMRSDDAGDAHSAMYKYSNTNAGLVGTLKAAPSGAGGITLQHVQSPTTAPIMPLGNEAKSVLGRALEAGSQSHSRVILASSMDQGSPHTGKTRLTMASVVSAAARNIPKVAGDGDKAAPSASAANATDENKSPLKILAPMRVPDAATRDAAAAAPPPAEPPTHGERPQPRPANGAPRRLEQLTPLPKGSLDM